MRATHPNRVSEEIEKAILDYSLKNPTHGALRVAQQLALEGVQVSSTGVTGVWSRNKLPTKHERLLRLEEAGTPYLRLFDGVADEVRPIISPIDVEEDTE